MLLPTVFFQLWILALVRTDALKFAFKEPIVSQRAPAMPVMSCKVMERHVKVWFTIFVHH